jgi:catechol 2,3-dioxygenase-like lactoylglutathione lyase family enzyme
MEARLSLVTLGISDLDRSVAFYRALGLEPAAVVPGEVAFFQLSGLVLALYLKLAEDAALTEARGPGLASLGHNVREKHEVDQVIEAARAAGGGVPQPARDTDWGGRSGYFTDPDGHLWEVGWNPFWPIDAEGRVRFKGPEQASR